LLKPFENTVISLLAGDRSQQTVRNWATDQVLSFEEQF